ncbi:MAG: hypothetical protein ACERLG_13770 [Sedimentibacter sp.]
MKLTKNEISFLSNQILENNKIGFFSNVNYNSDGTEESTLKQKGIYKDGKISAKDYEILKIVAKPERCTRFILKDKEFLVEKYAYKSANTLILAENDNGDMIFDIPDNFNTTIIELSEFTGMSNIKTSDIDVLLLDDEMLVLLAIVDIYRKKTMYSYWGQEIEYIISLAEIREMIDNPIQNGLLKMIINNYNYAVPKAEIIENILERLVDKKIIESKNGYALSKGYEAFATGFLIPQTVVMLETFNINEKEEIAIAGMLCVSAGLHDVVSFVFMDGEIQITSMTGSYMLEIVESFLKCPDILGQ